MGTRGVIGLRVNGQDWLHYNHSDSYPTQLGAEFSRLVLGLDLAQVRAYASTLTAVDESAVPTKAQLLELWPRLERTGDIEVELKARKDKRHSFRDLYNDVGNDIEEWVRRGLRFWPNSELFGLCSSCEWGYVLNLDDETLEYYTGHWSNKTVRYRKTLRPKGRYASHPELTANPDPSDHPLHLLEVVPLSELRQLPLWAVDQWMERLHREY